MRASVIVVAYNSRAYLARCIESVLSELAPDDELIVVDNGSTDGSADLALRYPRVRLLRGTNIGYAAGNNRGAAHARGDVLVFLNPDTALHSGALGALLAPYEQRADAVLTTACLVHMGQPEIVNSCGNTMHYTGLTYCRGAGRPRAAYDEPAEVDAVSGAAFAISRAAFEELGGFDESFFMYVEDTDLSWRARLAGCRCLYVAGAVVEHDYRPSYTPAKAFLLDRNRHLMLLKNLDRATYLRLVPGLLLGELVTGGYLLMRGPRFWGVKPRVYRALWRQRGALRRAHRAVQARRLTPDRVLIARMTHRLEFDQLAGARIARLAAALFHPAFRAARLLVDGGRP